MNMSMKALKIRAGFYCFSFVMAVLNFNAATGCAAEAPETLDGNWKSDCVHTRWWTFDTVSEATKIGHLTFTADSVHSPELFEQGTFTSSWTEYSDLDCKKPMSTTTIVARYELEPYSDEFDPFSHQDISFFHVFIDSISLTPLDRNQAEELNDIELCGLVGWKHNVANEITGRTCFEKDGPLMGKDEYLPDSVHERNHELFFGMLMGNNKVPLRRIPKTILP